MPSMECGHCGKVKRCRMVLEEMRHPMPGLALTRATYLCRPCARELGYLEPALAAPKGASREQATPEKPLHTPGPWKVILGSRMDRAGKRYGLEIAANVQENKRRVWESAGYVPLCDIYRPCNPVISVTDYTPSVEAQILETREANARLIAQAPALRDALQAVSDAWAEKRVDESKLDAAITQGETVLRACEGETPPSGPSAASVSEAKATP